MGIQFENMSRKELLELREKVDAALKQAEQREKKEALLAAERAAAEFGFSLAELSGETQRGTKGTKTKPKYRNPDNPEQTWSGRGRKPQWLHDALKAGVDISDLEI